MKKRDRRRALLEGQKPQMIDDIERMFGLGDRTWEEGPNFKPNRVHLIGMFDIINKYIFENSLDRSEPKGIVESTTDPKLKHTLAYFDQGSVEGMPHKIIVVRHPENTNFFNVFCTMIHEMIHLCDHVSGPLGRMLREKHVIGQLNWGSHYGTVDQNLLSADLKASQLPSEMPPHAGAAKQYTFPKFRTKAAGMFAVATGMYRDIDVPDKYELGSNPGNMYDVHGAFFQSFAHRANALGFDVQETFKAWMPHRLRKTWESEEAEGVPP